MSTNVNNFRYKAVIWGKQDTIFEYFDSAYGDTPSDALKRLKGRYRLDYNAYEYGVIDLNPLTERDRRMCGVREQPEQTNGTERDAANRSGCL